LTDDFGLVLLFDSDIGTVSSLVCGLEDSEGFLTLLQDEKTTSAKVKKTTAVTAYFALKKVSFILYLLNNNSPDQLYYSTSAEKVFTI
jgi:hypothetical protein